MTEGQGEMSVLSSFYFIVLVLVEHGVVCVVYVRCFFVGLLESFLL